MTAADAARSRYYARRRLLIERGQWQPYAGYADAGPVRAHVRALMAAGISRRQITRQSRTCDGTLSHLLYGRPRQGEQPQARMGASLAARILAVTADPDKVTGPGRIPPVATARRLQALATRGWSLRELAARGGLHEGSLRTTRSGARVRVFAATALAVRVLYDELWDQAPPERTRAERISAAKTRATAARHGWVPPAAWDDDTIADPAAIPAPARPARVKHRSADLVQDATEIAAQGHTLVQAAERIGITPDALETAIRRARRAA